MSENRADIRTEDIRTRLRELAHHLEHVLPAQAPIKDFVHHNTLHGFQRLPFREAILEAARQIGARGFLSEAEFRKLHQLGRIQRDDVLAALDSVAEPRSGDPLFGGLSRRDAQLAMLFHDCRPIARSTLRWQLMENGARRRIQPDVAADARARLLAAGDEAEVVTGLWNACLELLELREADLDTEELPETLHAEAPRSHDLKSEAASRLNALLERVGRDWTLRELLLALTGEDLMEDLQPLLVRQLAAHLDQGMAAWHHPERTRGFYTAWKASARDDAFWQLTDLGEWEQVLERLPDDALETIVQELTVLGLDEELWPRYLERLALELPGWSGMFLWRHLHPSYAALASVPVDLLDYLAVRLVLERIFAKRITRGHWQIQSSLPLLRGHFKREPAQLIVRHALFNEPLPEYLLGLAGDLAESDGVALGRITGADWTAASRLILAWRNSPAAESGHAHSFTRSAWPLFRLCQQLGLTGPALREGGKAGAEELLDCMAKLDEDSAGYVWLLAYERRYREQIFGALSANHGRGPWALREQVPEAQLVFCMDDREEGTRRHLEEINPRLETFGAAGFFGVAINWRGLDDHDVTPLCPIVVTPAHEVRETPRAEASDIHARHMARRTLRLAWKERLYQYSRRGILPPLLIAAVAGIPALLALVTKLLSPAWLSQTVANMRARFDVTVPTTVVLTAPADSPAATPQMPRLGFTDTEQADRVQGFLRTIGLQANFAPLVVLFGHGSMSQNNPHLSAYDCGACSGRHGGPNARVFAAMANRPVVRAMLDERGLNIPDTTWFIGAEHNTCDDLITWYDEDALPQGFHGALAKLKNEIAEASRLHAQERCRRFASAPDDPTPQRALAHVLNRSHDFSQARPELGHATNATAFIGRRSMSRGAFFDRRAFLISYDPLQDPDGTVVEAILLAAGPVGAGISLEYYFSTVNNERLGCGTKIVHNVSGLMGVMEGASSDLRTGLPRQMIEIHEAMRLLIVVEHSTEVLTAIYQRQPPLQELVGNGWVVLAAKDPHSAAIHLFDPATGWLRWGGAASELPLVERSRDWFQGSREPLTPALIKRSAAGSTQGAAA